MLSRKAAHPSTSALRVPSAARVRNSAHCRTAAAVHCADVCCGLNFTIWTVAPQRAHSTGHGAPWRSSARIAPPGACDRCVIPARAIQPASAEGSSGDRLAARFRATSSSQPATARVVSISNSYLATMSGSISAASR